MPVFKNGIEQKNKFSFTCPVTLEQTVVFALLDDIGLLGINAALKLYALSKPGFFTDTTQNNLLACATTHFSAETSIDLLPSFSTLSSNGLVFLQTSSIPCSIVLLTALPNSSNIPEYFEAIFHFLKTKGVKTIVVPGASLLHRNTSSHIQAIPSNSDSPDGNQSLIEADSIYSLVASFCHFNDIVAKFIIHFCKRPSQKLDFNTHSLPTQTSVSKRTDPLFDQLLVALGIIPSDLVNFSFADSFDPSSYISLTPKYPTKSKQTVCNMNYI
ncbi:hypothetical protein BB561_003502 [Smittium simulii]|uniref:Uncharacterized protein n=1 Tax=Smittium simulii TaxID=133385 RepID=A0A2T9YL12_9FUNG|nr:hypothetical protein BB561_003502 [Smittium simulii]